MVKRFLVKNNDWRNYIFNPVPRKIHEGIISLKDPKIIIRIRENGYSDLSIDNSNIILTSNDKALFQYAKFINDIDVYILKYQNKDISIEIFQGINKKIITAKVTDNSFKNMPDWIGEETSLDYVNGKILLWEKLKQWINLK